LVFHRAPVKSLVLWQKPKLPRDISSPVALLRQDELHGHLVRVSGAGPVDKPNPIRVVFDIA
jgi:hypothetical protein